MKTLLPTDDDWAAIDYINDILLALHERAAVAGVSLSLPESIGDGDDVHIYTLISGMQSAVETLCTSFVDHTSEGAWDGVADTHFASYADFKTKTGFAGWRAYTEDPENGGLVAYSQFVLGDIVRGWLWADLAEAIKLLKWTACYAVLDDSAREKLSGNYGGTGETLAAAQSGADGLFSAASEDALTGVTLFSYAHDYGPFSIPSIPWGWEAGKRSCKAVYKIYPYDLIDIHEITPPAGVSATWDLYLKPYQDTFTSFDAAGLGWAEDVWNKVSGAGASFTGTLTAINYETPAWGSGEQWSGMSVPNSGPGYSDQPFAVVKWTFSDN